MTNVVASADSTVVTRMAPSSAALAPVSNTGAFVEIPTVLSSGRADNNTSMLSSDTGTSTTADTSISEPSRARYNRTAASRISPTLRGRSSGTTPEP